MIGTIGALVAAAAQIVGTVTLACQSHSVSGPPDLVGQTQAERIVVDLDKRLWCDGSCSVGLPIAAVSGPDAYLLRNADGPTLRVNLSSGAYDSSSPGAYGWMGTCSIEQGGKVPPPLDLSQ